MPLGKPPANFQIDNIRHNPVRYILSEVREMKNTKRIISWLLTLAMVLALLPTSVFAASAENVLKEKITVNSPDFGTGFGEAVTIASDIDLRNATAIEINYTTNSSVGKEAKILVGSREMILPDESEGEIELFLYQEDKKDYQDLSLSVRRTEEGRGTVSYTITKISVLYDDIKIEVDNSLYEGYNAYTERVFEADGTETADGLAYNDGNTILLGEGKVKGADEYEAKKYSENVLFYIAAPSVNAETTQGVKPVVGKNVYLAGWQVYNQDERDYYDEIIAPDIMSLETLYVKYGHKSSFKVRPVIYPYTSFVRFNNSNPNSLAYTNNITNGKEIKVTMLDTLNVAGVGKGAHTVESFIINGFYDTDLHGTSGTARANNSNKLRNYSAAQIKAYLNKNINGTYQVAKAWNNSAPSNVIITPNCEAVYVDMAYTQPKIEVMYNPSADAPAEHKGEASVLYSEGALFASGSWENPLTITPANIGSPYKFSAEYTDPDNGASNYKVVWQDFTGDTNKDGNLTEKEQNAVSSYNLDRAPVIANTFAYTPRAADSLIYYYITERKTAATSGEIDGTVLLKEYPIFGNDNIVYTPLNNAAVTVNGISVTTDENPQYGGIHGNGGDGYFSISDPSFITGEAHKVDIVYGALAATAVQSVNVPQQHILDSYDAISVSSATRAKNGKIMGIDEIMYNDNERYTLTFAVESADPDLTVEKAVLRFYARDGRNVTQEEYRRTGDVFECSFTSDGSKLPAGCKITVTFVDNEGNAHFERDTGICLMQSLDKVELGAGFGADRALSFEVIGTVSPKFDFYHSLNLNNAGSPDDYRITDTEGKKTVESKKDKVLVKLTDGLNAEFGSEIYLTLSASEDKDHVGEWVLEEFVLVADAGEEVITSFKGYLEKLGLPVTVSAATSSVGEGIIVAKRKEGSREYYIADLTQQLDELDLLSIALSNADDIAVSGDFTTDSRISMSARETVDMLDINLNARANISFGYDGQSNIKKGSVKYDSWLKVSMLFFTQDHNLGDSIGSLVDSPQGPRRSFGNLNAVDSILESSLGDFEVSEPSAQGRGEMLLSSVATDPSVSEYMLKERINTNADIQLAALGGGRYIAVFLDDVAAVSAENATRLYYSIYDGSDWSEPKLIEDDANTDDSPVIHDIDDEKLFIAWSSAKIFSEKPGMLEALNSRNLHGVFVDKNELDPEDCLSSILEITKDTDLDNYADSDVHIAYNNGFPSSIVFYYTKRRYEPSSGYEGTLRDVVYPEKDEIRYRVYDVEGASWESEMQGSSDDDWYGQVSLDLAPAGSAVTESAAKGIDGKSLFAYVVDDDGDKSTTQDRDILMKIYTFEDLSEEPRTVRITSSDDVEEKSLQFVSLDGNLYLSYLSDGNVMLLDLSQGISDNMADDASLTKTLVYAEDCAQQIVDFDIRSEDDYAYVVFTQRTLGLKDGIDPESEAAKAVANTLVETQIYAARYDIANDVVSKPVAITSGEGANYANVAFAVDDNGGLVAMATKSKSRVEEREDHDFSTDGSSASALYSIMFTPKAKITAENPAIRDISSTGATASFTLYNGGIETAEDLTVKITDADGKAIKTFNEISLIGGTKRDFTFGVPVNTETNEASFTAVILDGDNELDSITHAETAYASVDVVSFNAEIKERGVIEFTAIVKNNSAVVSGERTFTVSNGSEKLFAMDISPLKPEETKEISGEIAFEQDELFVSVTEADGSVSATAVLTATAGDGAQAEKLSLVVNAEQMARMNSITDVSFASEGEISLKPGGSFDLDTTITADNYTGRYTDNNEGEIPAQGVTVKYLSDDESVVRVSDDGRIEGVGAGSATVTVVVMPAGSEYGDLPADAVMTYTFAVNVEQSQSSGGGGGVSRYTVKFETNGGSVVASKTVAKNSKLAEPADPTKEGFAFEGWYTDKELTTAYDFDDAVTKSFTLYAKWVVEDDADIDPSEEKTPFDDVDETDWFYNDVEFVYENGLMNGISGTLFAPNTNITRAMLVTVLYRAEGAPTVSHDQLLDSFDDVEENSWYQTAVAWAKANGIVNGVSATAFDPNRPITREQIAAIMYRYAQYKGYDVSVGENTNILSYDDFESISEYAIAPMQYAVGSGLMKGKTASTLNPLDNATRAEIAAILHRFIKAHE